MTPFMNCTNKVQSENREVYFHPWVEYPLYSFMYKTLNTRTVVYYTMQIGLCIYPRNLCNY